MRLAKVLGVTGRASLSLGILILLFVAYQLWGTGIREAQAQRALENELAEVLDEADASAAATAGEGGEGGEGEELAADQPPPPPPPVEGDALARIKIPEIGVDKVVVEGVSVEDLKRGPGHFPGTPLPGQSGNAAIAGHRTTYGAPFHRINELGKGDEINVTTAEGTFTYEVSEQTIVRPDRVDVLEDFGDDRLTLTACHPKFSAAQRIVVVAQLAGDPAPVAPPTASPDSDPAADSLAGEQVASNGAPLGDSAAASIDVGLAGETASTWPTVLLGIATAAVWLAAWVLGKLWRRWPAYLMSLPVLLFFLFFFYESISRVLPGSY